MEQNQQDIKHEWVLIILLTLLAVILRLSALDHLPLGLYRDEAYNGLDALRVLGGETPLFFEANNGREPLFIYLLATSVRLLGRTPGALRMVSALLGTASVPAIYWLARELYDRRVALYAGLLAATIVWMLNLSRVAFRSISMVPLAACALACAWRGRRMRSWAWMALAGLLMGATWYTYLAARFGAVALVVCLSYLWLQNRKHFWWQGWFCMGAAMLLIVAPLGLYLANHWSLLAERAAQVAITNPEINGGDLWGSLLRQVLKAGAGFVYRGDFIPRHNIPLRPVFDPFAGVAFVVGLALAVWRARRHPADGVVALWFGSMLLPTVLAEGAPHMLRATGVLPVLFLFPALGFSEAQRWLSAHWSAKGAALLLAVAIIASSVTGGGAYYRHLSSEDVYYNFETGATEMAVQINQFTGIGWTGAGLAEPPMQPKRGRQVYLAPRLWDGWPAVQYLCPQSDSLNVLDPTDSSELEGEHILAIMWPYEDNAHLLGRLPKEKLISVVEGARERGDLEQESRLLYYALQSRPATDMPTNAGVVWDQGIQLLGYELVVLSEAELAIDLYWQAKGTIDRDYTVFCHVLRDGVLSGQHDGPAAMGYYGTIRWRRGDVIQDRHVVALDGPYDPSRSILQVGIYYWEDMVHLGIVDSNGLSVERDVVTLG